MARALRFEYPGAIYHVINRGNYRSWVFEEEGSKVAFEKALFEACERAGWILHAYCIMGNHFHLAIETPEANLSSGMKWLQGVFATRYNRFRKERGHLFQGRFKSILVDGEDRLSWLCHYIHLNPVRAGIVKADQLATYRYSSFYFLGQRRKRAANLDFRACLNGAGELKDTPAGRSKYSEYLAWLSEDAPRQKEMLFEKMSKGWALASKDFKRAILKESKSERAEVERGAATDREQKELVWEDFLQRCLKELGKTPSDALQDPKSAAWKIAICVCMRSRSLCSNGWLSRSLNMGTDSGVSRYVREAKQGKRLESKKLIGILMTKIHS